MDEYRVLNSDGLRYADEFVKHKILDAIGDLYLAGHPLLGAFSAHKSGHALNNHAAAGPAGRCLGLGTGQFPACRGSAGQHRPALPETGLAMLLLRIVGILTAITIGSGIVAWLFTRDRRYWFCPAGVAKGALIFSLVVLV
jgi:hypothetical protein